MFRFGKHRKDVYPAQTEVITDYTTWSNDNSIKSATLGPSSSISSPAVNSNTSQAIANQSINNSQQHQHRQQRESSHERQLSNPNVPPSYHAPPANGHVNSKIAQNDVFNHRYSHYVNYDELQMQIR
jgi:partitioning defective protein 3